MKHIQCEIVDAINTRGVGDDMYVATIDLTLEVTNNQGLNPSLSFIHPHVTASQNFTAAISAQYSEQQHRTMNLSLSLLIDSSAANVNCNSTDEEKRLGSGIRGSLGIAEIFGSGMTFEEKNSIPIDLPVLGVTGLKGDLAVPDDAATSPTFASTVDFTLIYGIGGGPGWTLTHFSGINPSSGGLVNLLRTNKDTLHIAFAKVAKPPSAPSKTPAPATPPKSDPEHVRAAAQAAQDRIMRQLLRALPR